MRGARNLARDFPGLPATVDTSKFAVGENLALTPGHGRPAHRGLRAHPVRAADRAGARDPAALRAADDQQVLRARPRAGPQPGRVARAPGPAGVRHLVAQPGRRAGPLRPRHLRRAPCSRRATRSARITGQHVRSPQRRLLGRHHQRRRARPSRRRGTARRDRQREPDGRGARQRAGRDDVPRSPIASSPRPPSPSPPAAATSTASALERRLHLAASERPRLELRRQQLPAGQAAARVRRPVLEPGHGPAVAPACTATSSSIALENSLARPGALEVLGTPGRPRRCRPGQLHRRRSDRPHHPVGERVPQHAAARRRTRASCCPPSGHIQALVNPPAANSRATYRVADEHPAAPEAWLDQAADAARQLVDRLRPLAGRPLGRARACTQDHQARGARPRGATSMPAEALPYAHLGDALATDYFFVREQFTAEQWEHFIATRRFVDEEVLPVINDYWERGRAALAADAPARRARALRRGHRGLRLPGHEPARARPGEHGAAPRRRQPRARSSACSPGWR